MDGMSFVHQLEGRLSGGRLDDDAIAVGGNQISPLLLLVISDMLVVSALCRDTAEALYFVIEEGLAGLAIVQGNAVWVQTEPRSRRRWSVWNICS